MSERKPVYWAVVYPNGHTGRAYLTKSVAILMSIGGTREWRKAKRDGYTVRPFHLVPVEDGDE